MFILSMSLISKAFAPDSIFGRDRRLSMIALMPTIESHLTFHLQIWDLTWN
jgi:hypothetical protein